MQQQQQYRCDCIVNQKFTDFCIQEDCQLNRRLCGVCLNQHLRHHMIRFDNPQTFNVFKINEAKQFLGIEIQTILNITRESKNKILEKLNNLSQEVETAFEDKIIKNLKTLLNTSKGGQPQNKMKKVAEKSTHKVELSMIAQQIRILSKPHFHQLQWIRSMIECLFEGLSIFDTNLEQLVQQAKNEVEGLKSLSPFSSTMQQRTNQFLNRKQQKMVQEDLQKQKQRQKVTFLSKFSGNVIEWNNFYFTAEGWQTFDSRRTNSYLNTVQGSRKDINGIDLRSQNLDAIPSQLRMFTNIKRLDLNYNRIQTISNLKGFINLQILGLANNKIVQIQGLEELRHLQQLYLYSNKIKKIKGLQNLVQLKQLSLCSNQITKIQNLEHLTNLIYLDLNSNPLQRSNQQIKLLNRMKYRGLKTLYLPGGWLESQIME